MLLSALKQVVGIFAGFGVLLLLASPFLLLAAPCILCCKCKASKCCDDDDGDILPTWPRYTCRPYFGFGLASHVTESFVLSCGSWLRTMIVFLVCRLRSQQNMFRFRIEFTQVKPAVLVKLYSTPLHAQVIVPKLLSPTHEWVWGKMLRCFYAPRNAVGCRWLLYAGFELQFLSYLFTEFFWIKSILRKICALRFSLINGEKRRKSKHPLVQIQIFIRNNTSHKVKNCHFGMRCLWWARCASIRSQQSTLQLTGIAQIKMYICLAKLWRKKRIL